MQTDKTDRDRQIDGWTDFAYCPPFGTFLTSVCACSFSCVFKGELSETDRYTLSKFCSAPFVVIAEQFQSEVDLGTPITINLSIYFSYLSVYFIYISVFMFSNFVDTHKDAKKRAKKKKGKDKARELTLQSVMRGVVDHVRAEYHQTLIDLCR